MRGMYWFALLGAVVMTQDQQQQLDELDAEIARNIEQNALLLKERAALKRKIWEEKGDE